MSTRMKPDRRFVRPDPVKEARLHAAAVFQTLKELELARAINDPSLAADYDREIDELAKALSAAKVRIATLEARRGGSHVDGRQ